MSMFRLSFTLLVVAASSVSLWACFSEPNLEGLPCDPSQTPSCAGGFSCVDGACLSRVPDPIVEQSPECVQFLECMGRIDEEFGGTNEADLTPTYGPEGSCWDFAQSAPGCTQGCIDSLASQAETWPTWPECGGRQAQVCADYLACQADVDDENGTSFAADQEVDFGPLGTCWYADAGPAPVADCEQFCATNLASRAAGNPTLTACEPFVPDAGPAPPPVDGGS
jgi:hypothetical protein